MVALLVFFGTVSVARVFAKSFVTFNKTQQCGTFWLLSLIHPFCRNFIQVLFQFFTLEFACLLIDYCLHLQAEVTKGFRHPLQFNGSSKVSHPSLFQFLSIFCELLMVFAPREQTLVDWRPNIFLYSVFLPSSKLNWVNPLHFFYLDFNIGLKYLQGLTLDILFLLAGSRSLFVRNFFTFSVINPQMGRVVSLMSLW